jgi:RHS repeat-associated protein
VGLTTDETGTVTSHRRYHPFGLDRVYGGESFGEDDPHGFVGGIELRHDGMETGLVVLGARVLDSDVGRFLSQDPVFQWVYQYTYAQGNPVDWVDLEGRHPVPKAEAPSDLAAQLDGFAGFLEASSKYTITLAALLGLTGDPVAVPVGAVGVVLGAGAAAVGKLADAVRAAQSASEAGSRMPPPPPTPPETGGQDKRLELEGDLSVLSDLIRFTGSLGVGSPGTSGCSPAGVSGSDRGVLELQLLALLATLVALQIIGNRGRRTELRRSSGGSFDGR